MVDWLEELLALAEREDGDEDRELAELKTGAAVPAAPAVEIEMEDGVEWAASARRGGAGALMEAGKADWVPEVGTSPADGPGEAPGADGMDGAGVDEDGGGESGLADLLWDGLAAVVAGPDGSVVLRRPGAGDVTLEERTGRLGQVGTAEVGLETGPVRTEDLGLERLYRQTVRAGWPVAQAGPADQAGRSLRAEEPGRTAALTVDELDRAVRRDSWRYDGGMTIF